MSAPNDNAQPGAVRPPVTARAGLVCDFCTGPAPTWTFPCQDFVLLQPDAPEGDTAAGFQGGWAACDVCAALVSARSFGALVERSTEHQARHAGCPPWLVAEFRDFLRQLYRSFFLSRTGPGRRVTPADLFRAQSDAAQARDLCAYSRHYPNRTPPVLEACELVATSETYYGSRWGPTCPRIPPHVELTPSETFRWRAASSKQEN